MSDEKTYTLTEQEALSVYCSGITSGIASYLGSAGVPLRVAEVIGRQAGAEYFNKAMGDPAVRLALFGQIDRLLDHSLPVAERASRGEWL